MTAVSLHCKQHTLQSVSQLQPLAASSGAPMASSCLQIKADGVILEDKDFSDELIKFSFLEQVLRAAVEVSNALGSPTSGCRPLMSG